MWSAPWMTVTVWCSSSSSAGSPPVKMRRGFASVLSQEILLILEQLFSPGPRGGGERGRGEMEEKRKEGKDGG